MTYADGGIVSGGMRSLPTREYASCIIEGMEKGFSQPVPENIAKAVKFAIEKASDNCKAAFAPAPDSGKELQPVYSIEGIRMPMPSNVEADARVNDGFCPCWLVLDDLVPTKENDAQTPTTPLERP